VLTVVYIMKKYWISYPRANFFFFYIIANYIIDTVLVIDVGVQPNHVLLS